MSPRSVISHPSGSRWHRSSHGSELGVLHFCSPYELSEVSQVKLEMIVLWTIVFLLTIQNVSDFNFFKKNTNGLIKKKGFSSFPTVIPHCRSTKL